MSSSSLVLLLACLSCAVLSATSCCGCEEKKPEKPDVEQCCPNGWTKFENRCFMYHHTKKSWIDAEKHCQTLGGNLASITKAKEHFFVRGIIMRVTGYYNRAWIGGHDTMEEGVWMWSDGTKYSYNHWVKNQPDNWRNEDCIELNSQRNFFNDMSCSTKLSHVCAMNL